MDAFEIFSAKYLFVLSLVILGAYFLLRRWPAQKRMALFAIPAGILTFAIGYLVRLFYYDPRPFVVGHFVPLIQHAADNGFPSDHTLLVAALAMVGTYWNKWLGAALWVIVFLVGSARVYTGVHHAIDILASIIIAIVAVIVWHAIVDRLWKTKEVKEHIDTVHSS